SLFDDYTLGASADLGSTRIAGHTLRASANYKTDIHHEIDNDGALRERMQDETWGVAVEDRYQLAQAWTVAA
ncbi:MAG TPA: TonB-dependent receptor, partial [Gammaproteobacteria bacterium]|nr:TonB-dependent receptor [Gammaproteobacteria bacterium]